MKEDLFTYTYLVYMKITLKKGILSVSDIKFEIVKKIGVLFKSEKGWAGRMGSNKVPARCRRERR